MTNEEKAVIEAARAFVNDVDRSGRDRLVALRKAVHVLDEKPAAERTFWVNYQFNLADGRSGEGSAQLTSRTVDAHAVLTWQATIQSSISRDTGSSVSVVIRTWMELES
jgi:hypothetical protein